MGMNTFGMSAPMKVVAEHFGFTVDAVTAAARKAVGRTV
jgi:transketolase